MARGGNPMAGKADSKQRRGSAFDSLTDRRRRRGVDWRDVDCITVKAALATCVNADVAIMVSGASGGMGVCVTIWVDQVRHKEYANNAEELAELLDAIIDSYASSSEDVRATVAGVVVAAAESAGK